MDEKFLIISSIFGSKHDLDQTAFDIATQAVDLRLWVLKVLIALIFGLGHPGAELGRHNVPAPQLLLVRHRGNAFLFSFQLNFVIVFLLIRIESEQVLSNLLIRIIRIIAI